MKHDLSISVKKEDNISLDPRGAEYKINKKRSNFKSYPIPKRKRKSKMSRRIGEQKEKMFISADIKVKEEPVKQLIKEVITDDRFNAEEIVIVVDSPLAISESEPIIEENNHLHKNNDFSSGENRFDRKKC